MSCIFTHVSEEHKALFYCHNFNKFSKSTVLMLKGTHTWSNRSKKSTINCKHFFEITYATPRSKNNYITSCYASLYRWTEPKKHMVLTFTANESSLVGRKTNELLIYDYSKLIEISQSKFLLKHFFIIKILIQISTKTFGRDILVLILCSALLLLLLQYLQHVNNNSLYI